MRPVWLCPSKHLTKPGMCQGKMLPILPGQDRTLVIDIGLYGMNNNKKSYHSVYTTREMEKFVINNNGYVLITELIYLRQKIKLCV